MSTANGKEEDLMHNTTEKQAKVASVKSPDASVHLISGASAGLISAITLQPFDLLKTRLQQQQHASQTEVRTSIASELKKLTQIKDLWRGALPSTLRTSIGAGLYFTILSKSRTAWAQYKKVYGGESEQNLRSATSVLPKLTHLENLTIGFVSRAIVGYFTMPITVLKTRFESNLYNYNSMYDAVTGIYKDTGGDATKQGSIRNFFKGSVATLARDCPYAGLYVLFYEGFKNDLIVSLIPVSLTGNEQRSSIINSTSAILAASVSTTITAPFDAIKTRLQLTNETSIVKTTKILLAEDGGFRNLFRGLSLRFGRKALSAGISWCIYEEMIKSNFSQDLFMNKERLT
ncbi:mitochondrial carrier domain-containing protein [Scheffersomyces xylosifermentans]|uniref:mitochondrial carrier domain-containing protein n=1 Tax=Scheffersomyces xylosifermentans TaxID=1304137 RepID=UPI00315DD4AD